MRKSTPVLSNEQVADIRKLRENGYTLAELAYQYNVSMHTVLYACLGKYAYAHITEPPPVRKQFTKQKIETIVQSFQQGKDCSTIAQELGVSYDRIRHLIVKRGLHRDKG
jgi:orotate phosphoribosyltransferase-like protein